MSPAGHRLDACSSSDANNAPTAAVPGDKTLLGDTPELKPPEASLYCSCVGALLYYPHDRADRQYEVSLLGRVMGCPTEGGLTVLKRLSRYFKGTCDGRVEVVGYSDRDWAGEAGSRKSQSSAKIFADGVSVNVFSRRQQVIATTSGTREFHAAAAVAEHLLHFQTLLKILGVETLLRRQP